MSLLVLVALAASQAPPAIEPPPEEDIVVVGERIRRIRLITRTDRKTGEKTCRVRRSSGDKFFDQIFCDIVLDCARTATKAEEMRACVQAGWPVMAQQLAQARERRRGR